nr:uncharacterized protein LOC111506973 [Leptinotarsa decemlineata]
MSDDVVPPKDFGLPDGKIPTPEELLAAVEKLSGLSEENKEELRQSILRGAAGRMAEEIVPPVAQGGGTGTEILLLIGMISLVFLVIVFFGYKLYNSLVERERRKEEKRRQKQQKKKK